MSFFDILSLFGGLALFLYGMRLMGDGLKESSSGTLKRAMEHVTNNPFKAFLLGLAITALIQSSTATIVITAGLVGAGILTLHQSLGIIVGANVGTTVTGQIIRLLDLNADSGAILRLFQPSTLAPLTLVIGIILIMGFKNQKSIGNIAIGFGILFTGLMNMTAAVEVFGQSEIVQHLFTGLGNNPVLGYITGAAVAFVLQSSSATIGILQAFSSSGMLTFKAIYSVIVGVYLGDCVTTLIVCWIGAKAEPRRVGMVNIIFNFFKSILVLVGIFVAHHLGLLDGLWEKTVNSGIIANTNTVFNLACALVLLPFLNRFEKLSIQIVKDDPTPSNKYRDVYDSLSTAFVDTPALALRSCYDALLTSFHASEDNIKRAVELLHVYNGKEYAEIAQEEARIDELSDRISKYIVELLPHLQEATHVSILDQYYKMTTEFENLGDIAEDIADVAKDLHENNTVISQTAHKQLVVLLELIQDILDNAELAFSKRDVEAAYAIAPLEQVVDEMIDILKEDHLKRMSEGTCDIYADASFVNLMSCFKMIAGICSNVGNAVIVRVHPEVAKHKHTYFSKISSGTDENYNQNYAQASQKYMEAIQNIDQKEKGVAPV